MSRRYSVILLIREDSNAGPGLEGSRQLASGSNLALVMEKAIRELRVLLDKLRAEQQASGEGGPGQRVGG